MRSLHGSTSSMAARVSALTLVVWLFAFANLAAAQPPDNGFSQLPPTNAVALEHEGVQGLWMPEEMSRSIQADIEELQRLRVVLERQSAKIEMNRERIANMLEILELVRAEREFAVNALDEAIKGRREAEEARDAWYRSPELWSAVGAVVGVTLVLVAAELVPEARSD